MLEPNVRHLLLESLRPPTRFALDAAVATTFTLDLTAALIPPLAFTAFGLDDVSADPMVALEAIARVAERTAIFCQTGMIEVPHTVPDLVAFLEPMVHQIVPPPGTLFHPKLWVLRYIDEEGAAAYRLLVLSRNLTHDNSWDVIVRLDSAAVESQNHPGNGPLCDLLIDLASTTVTPLSPARRSMVESLASDIRRVEWQLPPGVDGVTFHYLRGRRPQIDWTARRSAVISPFVNDAGIEELTGASHDMILISRPDQLEMLSPAILSQLTRTYVLDAAAGNAPQSDQHLTEEDAGIGVETLVPGAVPLRAHLHAKVYVLEPPGRRQRARLLLGSANATSSGLRGNTEFLVEFEGPRRNLGVDALLGAEADGLRQLLAEYTATGGATPTDREDVEHQVDNTLRTVAAIPHRVRVVSGGDAGTGHRVEISSSSPYPDRNDAWQLRVGLLTLPGREQPADFADTPDVVYEAVTTADISPFVTVHIDASHGVSGSTVLVAELEGDPFDRLDHVMARQIDTPEKLMRLIRLLLDSTLR